MASSQLLTVIEESRVSPPPGTVSDTSYPLNFFDLLWLRTHPIHNLFFYEIPKITQTNFIHTIIPNLKHSLSITLQHFFPFAGKLVAFPPTKKPEIRYVEGDSVAVTFAECNCECNLDFHELVGNHPRKCEMFYHLIPSLGQPDKTSDSIKINLFSVQVTLFPNFGLSIGMTNHHSLGDASTRFSFMKTWTSIARFGTNGTLPVYDRDRVAKNPKVEESIHKFARVDTFVEDYEPPKLCGPTDKVRATFVLTRSALSRLKNTVSTQLPTVAYVSSITVACAYIWSCIATARDDEQELFVLPMDCRARMNPPLPPEYFGNCAWGIPTMEKTTRLKGKEGFVTAARLIGEGLHDALTDKNGVVQDTMSTIDDLVSKYGVPTSSIGISGTPKLKFYDLDFGWGKANKIETISIDYDEHVSMNACREKSEDVEIGICLPATQMECFVRVFKDGLETYI